MSVELVVVRAGPLVTVQDRGRPGRLRFGVPASGPMDRLSAALANAAVGNDPDAALVEISAAGLEAECRGGRLTVAVVGGDFSVARSGRVEAPWSVVTLQAGDRLDVRPGTDGNWCYLAVAGGVVAPDWLGSVSTLARAGFGGRVLEGGDRIELAAPTARPERDGVVDRPPLSAAGTSVRVVLGPQDHRFESGSADTLLTSTFSPRVFDRMGVRLDGPPLPLRDVLSIPSEPVLKGSVQVDGAGVASILLADHQTAGGYPKIATVVDADLDTVAQTRPGEPLAFVAVTPEEAVVAARARATAVADAVEQTSRLGRTLEHRLRQENLVDGAVDVDEER